MKRSIEWRRCCIFFHALVIQIQDGDTDIAANSLELVKTLKGNVQFPPESIERVTGLYFQNPLIPGNFSLQTENVFFINIPTGITGISGISW